jgi:hypothetical protein
MAYIVTKTNGQILATIRDGTVDSSTSLSLVGKNYIGYGEVMAENLLHLLENFAGPSAPTSPIAGQIWFNSTTKQLNCYSGTEFVPMMKTTISSTQPTAAVQGDSWWNTQAKKFNVYDGTEWQEIGPLDTTPFARLAQDNQFTGNISISGSAIVGSGQTASLSVAASGIATLKNTTPGKDLLLGIRMVGGAEVAAIVINGSTGQAEVAAPTGSLAIANKSYVDTAASTLNAAIVAVDTKADGINSNLISYVSNLSSVTAQLQQDKANVNSPALTGIPTTPTPALNTVTKQVVNAEFVQNNLALKANLDSPIFTGTPQAPTASVTENSGVLATTAFVKNHCNIEILNNATLTGTARATTTAGSDNSTAVATTAFVHGLLPRGVILMWSGANIPAGWVLCDGTNGTPDLRNRFIVGASPSYPLGSTGGATSSSATTQAAGAHSHGGATQTHVLTVDQIPSHSHGSQYDTRTPGSIDFANSYSEIAGVGTNWTYPTAATGGNQGHAHGIATDGDHTHSISPISTIPPYYALAYIMKVF